MHLYYLAHPYGGKASNLRSARRWYTWLINDGRDFWSPNEPAALAANWIVECELFDDSDPDIRDDGINRGLELCSRCDGIILVGGTLSSGMFLEQRESLRNNGRVINLLHLGEDPPATGNASR